MTPTSSHGPAVVTSVAAAVRVPGVLQGRAPRLRAA